ncbi:MAG TPA: response regulator [Polyangiales bacterium]
MADILIVEDHALTLKLARLTLQADGHRVRTAPNGANALAQATLCLPDLVLLDLMLPDNPGRQVLDWLRALPGARRLPVVAFSVYMTAAERPHAIASGFTDLVPKPVAPSALTACIRAHLVPS